MNKLFLSAILIFFSMMSGKAQFANTRWTGEVNSDQPFNVIWDFKNDTVKVYMLPDSSLLETMTYKVQDSLLVIKKVSGQSDCDDVAVGKYKIDLQNDKVTFFMVDDPCEHRSAGISKETYTLIK